MERQPEEDLQPSSQKLDSSSMLVVAQSQQVARHPSSPLEGIASFLWTLLSWFLHLPVAGKIGLLCGGIVFGFAIFQAVLKLIASIIGVTLLVGLVYLGYKFFASDISQSQQN